MASPSLIKKSFDPPDAAWPPFPTYERRSADESDSAASSRVEEVYNLILARIVRGELAGGTELKSTQISTELGVSRTPVVQALSRLIADGIVTQRLNMRAVVRPGAENWLVEIHELRLLLEPGATANAARNMSREVIEQLERHAAAVAPAADPDWLRRAREFDYCLHLTIADYAGNQPLRDAIYKCWRYKWLSYELGLDPLKAVHQGYEEHRSIIEAIKVGDSPMAAAAMELHLRHASSHRPEKLVI